MTKTSIQCKIKNTDSGFDRAHTSFLIRILWLDCDMREDRKKKRGRHRIFYTLVIQKCTRVLILGNASTKNLLVFTRNQRDSVSQLCHLIDKKLQETPF